MAGEEKTFNPRKIKQKQTSALIGQLFENADIPSPKIEQSWSEVDDISQSVAEGIVDIASNINSCIQFINTVNGNFDKGLIVTINGVKRDIKSLVDDLVKIKKRHTGMVGIIKDEEELGLCLSVFNDYVILNDRFRAIIFPSALSITEAFGDAMNKWKEEQKIAKEQEVKETINE